MLALTTTTRGVRNSRLTTVNREYELFFRFIAFGLG
jgi:hypothetical protein